MTSSQDPEQIRQEIERTQANLGRDVDALTGKVTPGRIVERRVNRVRSTASRWRDAVMGSAPSTGGHGGGASEAWSGVRDRAGDVQQRAGEAVSQAASTASGTVQQAASTTGATVQQAASTAASALQEAPQVARRQAQGNPLAAGLIAFGVGWLVSSLIPATSREQRAAEQAYEAGREKARDLAPAAQQVAGEVRDNLREPAQQAAESVRQTATEGGRTVAEEARSAGTDVRDRAQDAAGSVRGHATN